MIDARGGNDSIAGLAGNDTLIGGLGADSLTGVAGDDTYVVDNAGDVVTESLNEGLDTVQSAISYTLGTNVENLTLTGSNALDGTGNDLANVLVGNDAANVLAGGDGNDTLTGQWGNDILNGGLGVDVLSGGAGDDTLYVDAPDTSVNGDAGFDVMNVVGAAGVTLDVAAASIEVAIGGGTGTIPSPARTPRRISCSKAMAGTIRSSAGRVSTRLMGAAATTCSTAARGQTFWSAGPVMTPMWWTIQAISSPRT